MTTPRSFLFKLDRAREHIESLEAESGKWISSNPFFVVDEADPAPRSYALGDDYQRRRFRVTRFEPIPDRLSVIIGDCLFNLRSALDHLAMALGEAHTPRMSDDQIRGSEFPIFHKQAMNAKTEREKLGAIAPAAADLIKSLQPLHRRKDYELDPLWQLHELNRIDKHRSLTICAAIAFIQGGYGVGLRNPFNIAKEEFGYVLGGNIREVVNDAVLLRYAARPVDANQAIHMEPVLPLVLAFGSNGPLPLEPVAEKLTNICDYVRDSVVTPLSACL